MLSPEHQPKKHHDVAPGIERKMRDGRPAMEHYCEGKGTTEGGRKLGHMAWKEKHDPGAKGKY